MYLVKLVTGLIKILKVNKHLKTFKIMSNKDINKEKEERYGDESIEETKRMKEDLRKEMKSWEELGLVKILTLPDKPKNDN